MNRVIEVLPSKDGCIKFVKVKMKIGEFFHPVLQLIPDTALISEKDA